MSEEGYLQLKIRELDDKANEIKNKIIEVESRIEKSRPLLEIIEERGLDIKTTIEELKENRKLSKESIQQCLEIHNKLKEERSRYRKDLVKCYTNNARDLIDTIVKKMDKQLNDVLENEIQKVSDLFHNGLNQIRSELNLPTFPLPQVYHGTEEDIKKLEKRIGRKAIRKKSLITSEFIWRR